MSNYDAHMQAADDALRGTTPPGLVQSFGYDWAIESATLEPLLGRVRLTLRPYQLCALPAWNGKGLPPIGTKCEVLSQNAQGEWVPVEIVGHDRDKAVYRLPEGNYLADRALFQGDQKRPLFRPLRTAEQLAAEARQVEIDRLCNIVMGHPRYPEHNRNIDCSAAMRLAVEAIVDA